MPFTFAGVETAVLGTGVRTAADTSAATQVSIDVSAVPYGLTFIGNAGDNLLAGTAWSDQLRGGADRFVFNAVSAVDTVTAFLSGIDKLAFDNAVFAQVGADGSLAAGTLRAGALSVADVMVV